MSNGNGGSIGKAKLRGGMFLVVGFLVILILAGELLPVGVNTFNDINTTARGWDSSQVSLFNLIPMFAIVGVLLWFVMSAVDV